MIVQFRDGYRRGTAGVQEALPAERHEVVFQTAPRAGEVIGRGGSGGTSGEGGGVAGA